MNIRNRFFCNNKIFHATLNGEIKLIKLYTMAIEIMGLHRERLIVL